MSDTVVRQGQWIQFVDEGVPRKTHVYRVETLADFVEAESERVILGTVKWFGRWRGYAFFPGMQTVYEPTCLREIADFCADVTTAHRLNGKPATREEKTRA